MFEQLSVDRGVWLIAKKWNERYMVFFFSYWLKKKNLLGEIRDICVIDWVICFCLVF